MKQATIHVLVSVISFLSLIFAQDEEILYDRMEIEPEISIWFNNTFPEASVLKRLGEISGVYAVNKSHIYVFHRANRKWEINDFDDSNVFTRQDFGPIDKPTIALIIDGRIAQEFGEGLFFIPHSITVDQHGNIWTSDVALHQIFKFNKDDLSKPTMILGERFKPGNDKSHFCKPTDVKIASNGDFFVSDGYCNSRVLKFMPNGTLITSWGSDLSIVHSLAIMETTNELYVADRTNQRVIVYSACLYEQDECGEIMSEKLFPDPVYAIDLDEDLGNLYVLLGGNRPSYVQLIDLQNFKMSPDPLIQEINLGAGHTISTIKENGFIVGSLIENCSPQVPCELAPLVTGKNPHGGLFEYLVV